MLNSEEETSYEAPLEAHENKPWLPDVSGHGKGSRRRLSKTDLKQLEQRTEILKKEILGDQEGKEAPEK